MKSIRTRLSRLEAQGPKALPTERLRTDPAEALQAYRRLIQGDASDPNRVCERERPRNASCRVCRSAIPINTVEASRAYQRLTAIECPFPLK